MKILERIECESLESLQDSNGDLESFCQRNLHGAGIAELPESIGKLRNLTRLHMTNNRLRSIPATIGALARLQVLDVYLNGDLQGQIPSEFGGLKSLECLNLSWTGICGLPASIVQLSRLEGLYLKFCDAIQDLPDLPMSLTTLQISSRSIKAIPGLSNLTKVINLSLSSPGNHEVPTGSTTAWTHHQA